MYTFLMPAYWVCLDKVDSSTNSFGWTIEQLSIKSLSFLHSTKSSRSIIKQSKFMIVSWLNQVIRLNYQAVINFISVQWNSHSFSTWCSFVYLSLLSWIPNNSSKSFSSTIGSTVTSLWSSHTVMTQTYSYLSSTDSSLAFVRSMLSSIIQDIVHLLDSTWFSVLTANIPYYISLAAQTLPFRNLWKWGGSAKIAYPTLFWRSHTN
jgi:hypothetical protein